MAYTTIDDPSVYFQTALYSSDSSSVTVTNDGNSDLQPDWIWIKVRNGTNNHNTFDTSRGVANRLKPNTDDAEDGSSGVSVSSDGFATGTSLGDINNTGGANNYVAWQWKANGGTATATGAESGNNPAYSAQANQTAGFSIITYTGTGAEGDVTHGLGGKPDWIITKNRDESSDSNWVTWHKDLVDADADNGGYIYLNTTGQDQATSVFYEGDAISSSVVAFKGGNQNTNKDSIKYVMYCFRSIQGYSKFGQYTGNGDADGTFVYTGFKPAWIMTKKTSNTSVWGVLDNKRVGYNVDNNQLYAEQTGVEGTGDILDIVSNGFKFRNSDSSYNESGGTFIYMAFAENPFVSSKGVPTTAR